ncbi:MAG: Cof-type HAD-IIB family hydrolase [Lachnospiraceae bacterium]|nr:Cof-type HAD-IIB family hydrolase [Lachnospiraceae bacterium]
MENIRLVALDLDGTLLNSDKQITDESRKVLYRAAEQGIEIVPCTGRFFGGMPESVRKLPFLHYAITVNGASVYDVRQEKELYSSCIPWEKAVEVIEFIETLDCPLVYDAYIENWGWMPRVMQENVDPFGPDPHYLKMLKTFRTPVENLKDFISENKKDVQKLQIYMLPSEVEAHKAEFMKAIADKFEWLAVTSSVINNIEMNFRDANKGDALMALAAHLGISREQVAAFGDGSNDLTMIKAAGFGVAMENGVPELHEIAEFVTRTNDEEGIAFGFRKFLK